MTMGNEGDGEKFHTHAIGVVVDYSLSLLSLDRRRGEKDIELRSPLALDSHGEGGGGWGLCICCRIFFGGRAADKKEIMVERW